MSAAIPSLMNAIAGIQKFTGCIPEVVTQIEKLKLDFLHCLFFKLGAMSFDLAPN